MQSRKRRDKNIVKVDFSGRFGLPSKVEVTRAEGSTFKVGFFLPSSTLGTFIYLLAVRSIFEGRFLSIATHFSVKSFIKRVRSEAHSFLFPPGLSCERFSESCF